MCRFCSAQQEHTLADCDIFGVVERVSHDGQASRAEAPFEPGRTRVRVLEVAR